VSRPVQRTHAELQQAPPEVVSKWLHAGELHELLAGGDPGRHAGSEPEQEEQKPAPRPDAADQGARSKSGVEQVTENELRFMTASQIVAARKAGRLVDLGVGA
jgi:hypothetical protein